MKTMSFDELLDINLADRQVRLATTTQRTKRNRAEIEQAMLEVFELVGGVPRLALWANNPENYGEFLKLVTKLLPKEAKSDDKGTTINFVSSVPDSDLNNPKPDEMKAIEHDDGSMSEDL